MTMFHLYRSQWWNRKGRRVASFDTATEAREERDKRKSRNSHLCYHVENDDGQWCDTFPLVQGSNA